MEQTISYKGYDIEIKRDNDALSPQDMGDDYKCLIYDHRDFCVRVKGFDCEDVFEAYSQGEEQYNNHWIFPVYAYIHSGVSLSLHRGYDRWDTSFKGFALVKQVEGWSDTKKQATEKAQYLIEEWNQYLSGEVYGYNIEDGESCWGYYGDPDKSGCIDEAKAIVDHMVKDKISKHITKRKKEIKSKVPFQYRKELV